MEQIEASIKQCAIDSNGVIIIPVEFCNQLSWEIGDKLDVTANIPYKFIELSKNEIFGELQIGENHSIVFSPDYKHAMGWNGSESLNVKFNPHAETLSVYVDISSSQSCVFCKSDDIGLTVEGLDICKYHISTITGVPFNGVQKAEMKKFEPLMGNVKIATLDDLGRLIIPATLHRQIGWYKGIKLSASVNTVNKEVILEEDNDGVLEIGELSFLALPKEMRTELGWGASDKIAVTLCTENNHIKLAMEDRYVPSCVFCGSANVKMTVQGLDICERHIAYIKSSGAFL